MLSPGGIRIPGSLPKGFQPPSAALSQASFDAAVSKAQKSAPMRLSFRRSNRCRPAEGCNFEIHENQTPQLHKTLAQDLPAISAGSRPLSLSEHDTLQLHERMEPNICQR